MPDTPTSMSTEVAAQKPLVLLVDDFLDTRSMYAEFLDMSGFRVAEAQDGLEAVAKAVSLSPDLIVMDMSLPNLDGCEATRRIRADDKTAHIPIIAVSGHSGATIDEARRAGCDEYLTKPCLPDDLVARIQSLLER